MKSTIICLGLTTAVLAAPTTYAPPPGGWSSIDWTKIDYPEGTGKDAVPEGGWDSVDWSKVDYSNVDWSKIDWNKVDYSDGKKVPDQADDKADEDSADGKPAYNFFTSTHYVAATPDQVVNGTTPTGGLKGSQASFWFGIRKDINLICYDITLSGFRGNYQSPALTATHIHEAAKGQSGPPRIAFPNPVGDADERKSVGCIAGPFKTGIMNNGKDSGEGFHVSQIADNPAAFFADVHSSEAVPGAVRGQIA